MRRLLLLSVVGLSIAPASAMAASVSIDDFSYVGGRVMQATITAQEDPGCIPGSGCAQYVELVTRPSTVGCPFTPSPTDPAYYNVVARDDFGGTPTTKSYQFDPGTYRDALGTHPIPFGYINLCAFVKQEQIGFPRSTLDAKIARAYFGPTGQRAAALRKCKKKLKANDNKKKFKTCKKKAKKLPV